MGPKSYILARTLGEAHRFARQDLGLRNGQYRVVNHPSALSGVRGATLHLVPGHEKRHDRFAMTGALRYTRLEVVDHSKVEESDGLEPAGVQLSLISDEEAGEFFEQLPTVVSEQAKELAENVKRRRRRCKECGILVEPDEVDSHAADHAADLVSLGSIPEA